MLCCFFLNLLFFNRSHLNIVRGFFFRFYHFFRYMATNNHFIFASSINMLLNWCCSFFYTWKTISIQASHTRMEEKHNEQRTKRKKNKRNIQYLALFNWFIEKMLLLMSHSFVTMFSKIGPKVSKMKINYSSSDRIRFCCCSLFFFFSVIDVDLVIVVVIGYSASCNGTIHNRSHNLLYFLRVRVCTFLSVAFKWEWF